MLRYMHKQLTLEKWYKTNEGTQFAKTVETAVAPVIERIFGYYAMQVGYAKTNLLANSPIKVGLDVTTLRDPDAFFEGING